MNYISTPYKIIIAIPVLFLGGTEMQTLNLVRGLLSARYEITICCYYNYDHFMVSKLESTGANVILMNLNRSDGVFRLMGKLREIFREINPDVVHVQYIAPGLIPIIAAKLSGIKTVFATVHQPGRPYGWRPKLLIRAAAQLCDAFFCNSKSVEKSWFGDCQILDPEKIDPMRKHFTIYNGVDCDWIEGVVKQTDREGLKESLNIQDKKVVGVVGRLREEKGHPILLESMKIIIKELPDTVLLVVGDGPDRENLKSMVNAMGIDGCVKWLGQKDPDEVIKLFSIMDAVAIPSVFEGFGLAAVEAMAAGRPVVASNVDGLNEMIQGGVNGLLVRPGDSRALAGGILEILSNPAEAASMGVRGRKMVEEQLSMARFYSTILAAYSYYTQRLN